MPPYWTFVMVRYGGIFSGAVVTFYYLEVSVASLFQDMRDLCLFRRLCRFAFYLLSPEKW